MADRLLTAPDGLFPAGMTIRLIGVGVSKLSEAQARQMDLFTWAKEKEVREMHKKAGESAREKQEKLDAMLQSVNTRFGNGRLKKGMGRKKNNS